MRSKHAARRMSVALAVGAVSLIGAASAQAAFVAPNTLACSGSTIAGGGASFQNLAHNDATFGFIAGFKAGTATGSCGPLTPFGTASGNVTYDGTLGSGGGMDKFGRTNGNTPGFTRDATVRFVGTDDPPTVAQQANMEAGDSSITTDDGTLHTIPVAAGAVALMVNFPLDCTIPAAAYWKPATGASATYPADGTTRFKTTNARIEAAFEGSISTWGQFLPGIAAVVGNTSGATDSSCAAFPIKRVVRKDSSGTTFAWKKFLQFANDSAGGTQNWSETATQYSQGPLGNIAWPNDTGATAVVRSGSTGGGALATLLSTTPGGIGYADLATARSKGFDMTPATIPAAVNTPADRTFWIPVTNGSGQVYDPQKNAGAYKFGAATTAKGANCVGTVYSNVPAAADPTLSNWAAVTGAGSTVRYGACTLTYQLAWDDASKAYGNTPTEQAKARTVFDYEKFVTGNGQKGLYPSDYAPVPASIKPLSVAGAKALGWNK